ncbi:MAG: NAD(P)-dependent glycerol-1-phosphate dehydrogenase [Candidatus Altiarchaeales archaeon]|nr:NAD(P)-dependent glycerol-1-phosphate dehydrogenase [Candidatus Altiarchaeales archaeon]
MKDIELPRKVLVGENALYEADELVFELGLRGKPLILCDDNTRGIAGDIVSQQLDCEAEVTETSSEKEIKDYASQVTEENRGYVVGVGGGRVIDTGKLVAFESKTPFISVPTSASHDGIASPQVSIKQEKPLSLRVHCPLGVLGDTKIIGKAPEKLLSAGCADAISNFTAVLDWELAHQKRGEYFGDYAAALSRLSAEIVIQKAEKISGDVSILVEALISSGVAIGIAGSSRPCSGAEHMFSHTLDLICEKPALHGHQCGVGSILTACLHNADWLKIKNALENCGAPTCAGELGIADETVIEALVRAHDIRNRHTILGDGLTEDEAWGVARKTGVVE